MFSFLCFVLLNIFLECVHHHPRQLRQCQRKKNDAFHDKIQFVFMIFWKMNSLWRFLWWHMVSFLLVLPAPLRPSADGLRRSICVFGGNRTHIAGFGG